MPTIPRKAAEVEGAAQSPSLSAGPAAGQAPGEVPHSQGRELGRAGSQASVLPSPWHVPPSLGKGSSKKHVLKPLLLRKGSVC